MALQNDPYAGIGAVVDAPAPSDPYAGIGQPVAADDPYAGIGQAVPVENFRNEQLSAVPEENILMRGARGVRESLSPFIGPTARQRSQQEADRAAVGSILGREVEGDAINTEGLLNSPLFSGNKTPWALPDDISDKGLRNLSLVADVALPGSGFFLRRNPAVGKAIVNTGARTVNSITAPASLLTLGVGGALSAAKAAVPVARQAIVGSELLFGADQARQVAESVPDVIDASGRLFKGEGDTQQDVETILGAAANAGLGAVSGVDAIRRVQESRAKARTAALDTAKPPAPTPDRGLAPVTFIGMQDADLQGGTSPLFIATRDIPELEITKGGSVARDRLESAGYYVPSTPESPVGVRALIEAEDLLRLEREGIDAENAIAGDQLNQRLQEGLPEVYRRERATDFESALSQPLLSRQDLNTPARNELLANRQTIDPADPLAGLALREDLAEGRTNFPEQPGETLAEIRLRDELPAAPPLTNEQIRTNDAANFQSYLQSRANRIPLPDNARVTVMEMGGRRAEQIDIPTPDGRSSSLTPFGAAQAGYDVSQVSLLEPNQAYSGNDLRNISLLSEAQAFGSDRYQGTPQAQGGVVSRTAPLAAQSQPALQGPTPAAAQVATPPPAVGGTPPPALPPTATSASGAAAPNPNALPQTSTVPLTIKTGTWNGLYTDAKSKLVDFTAPIEDLYGKFQKQFGYTVPPTRDIINQHDRALAAPSIAAEFMRTNGFADIVQNVDSLDTYGQYLIDKRALELDAAGIQKTGVDLAKAQANVAANSARYAPMDAKIRDVNKDLLRRSVEYGLISPELAAKLDAIYPDYVPFERTFDELELATRSQGSGRGLTSLSRQSVFRKLEGSDRAIQNPLGSFLKKAEDIAAQGERNRAGELLAGYRDLPGWDGLIQEVNPNDNNAPHTFSYLDGGKKRTFTAPKEVTDAAKALNVQSLGAWGKILSLPVRLAKIGITGINLPFVLANVPRDQVAAVVNSRLGVKALMPAYVARATVEAFGHGLLPDKYLPNYNEMMSEGGLMSSFKVARDNTIGSAQELRADKNIGTKALYTITHPSQWLAAVENVMSRGEEATRLQQFIGTLDTELKNGRSREDAVILAARSARESTANFARRGEWGRVLNAGWMYLNAGIQGSRAFVRSVERAPVSTALKLGTYVATPVVVATMWNLKDEERRRAYADISEIEKQNNIIIVPPHPVQDESGRWNVVKIPLPPGMGNFGSLVRRPFEQWAGEDPVKFGEAAQLAIGTVSPVQPNLDSVVNVASPQLLKPLAEVALNKNFFTHREVVPDRVRKKGTASMQYDEKTSGSAILAARVMENAGIPVSPMQIEHVVKGYTGGVGGQATHYLDKAMAAYRGDPKFQIGGRGIGDDLSRRFLTAQGGQNLNRFYQHMTAAEEVRNGYQTLLREGKDAKADAFYEKNATLIDLSSFLVAQRENLQSLDTQLKFATEEGDKEEQKIIRGQKSDLARDAYETLLQEARN